jgi:hypothetical protein
MIPRLFTFLFVWVGLLCSGPALATDITAPEAAVTAFYRWYLQEGDALHDPLTKDRKTMSKYVTAAALREALRERNSPNGPDEDYFTKAQDSMEDWKTAIAFRGTRVNGKQATTTVVLGAQGSAERNWLDISLVQDRQNWKINRVRPHQAPRP